MHKAHCHAPEWVNDHENECAPDCIGKDDSDVTLIGRKHYFESLGITAANADNATLDTRNYQMYEESIGYVKGHTKVLVTAAKE